jgi:8-oxo-dGTP pyrophosphatase MutT (NUDIX family)
MKELTPSSSKPSSSSEQGKQNRSQQASGRGRAHSHRHHGRGKHAPRKGKQVPGIVRRETSAGGIIFRIRAGAVEVFFIKDSYGRWTFPKGHQELGETLAETAIREIREETGMTGLAYQAPLGKTSFRFRREGATIYKSVHYFLFEASATTDATFRTRAEVGEGRELIQEGQWVPMRQAFAMSSYKNSDHLLANAFRIIGARHDVSAVAPGRHRRHRHRGRKK